MAYYANRLIMASLVTCVLSKQLTVLWQAKALGSRYIVSGSVVATFNLSKIMCSASCFQNPSCVSFNHEGVTRTCEMLNTASYKQSDPNIVVSNTWNYYMFVPPNPSLDASSLCPSGSVLVKYDQPIYLKYDFSLDGYTCTRNQWVLNEYNAGRTDCRLVLMYDVDYPGYDTAYANTPGTYYGALKQCITYNCVGMICLRTGVCWLKYTSHIINNIQPTVYINLLYWYTRCQ